MSKGYWNSKADTSKLMKAFKSNFEGDEANKKFESFFGAARDSVELNMAARLIRGVALSAIAFRRAVYSSLSSPDSGLQPAMYTVFDNCPLITLGKSPGTVRVFTNLIVGPATETDLKEVCWIQFEPLRAFMEAVTLDKGSELGRQKWETPARSWARIKRYSEMPIGRALNRYTQLPKHLTETALTSLSANVHELLRPMEIKYATKPEDYLEMYKADGVQSCMSANKGGGDLKWNAVLFDHGHHPCSWFAYHSKIRGVYATRKGKVIARTYLHKSGDKEYYGRIYGATPQHVEQFTTNLKDAGYDSIKNDNYSPTAMYETVEIPGLFFKGESRYYCPVPYFDNIVCQITADFDSEKKVFKFYVGKKTGRHNLHMHNTCGWVTNTVIEAPRCARHHCSNTVQATSPVMTDGSVFCSPECAFKAGYISAKRSDNTVAWVRKTEAYYDSLAGEYYSNLNAAITLGALPLLESFNAENEDCEQEYTVAGTIVVKDDTHYAFVGGNDVIDHYFRNKMLVYLDKNVKRGGRMVGGFKWVGSKDDKKMKVQCKTQRNVEIDDTEKLVVNV